MNRESSRWFSVWLLSLSWIAAGIAPVRADPAPSPAEILALPECPLLCSVPQRVIELQRHAEEQQALGKPGLAAESQAESLALLGCRIIADQVALANYLREADRPEAAARQYSQSARAARVGDYPGPRSTASQASDGIGCQALDPNADNLPAVWSVLAKAQRCARVEASFKSREISQEKGLLPRSADDAECLPRVPVVVELGGAPAGSEILLILDGQPLTRAEQAALFGAGYRLQAGSHLMEIFGVSASVVRRSIQVPWRTAEQPWRLRIELNPDEARALAPPEKTASSTPGVASSPRPHADPPSDTSRRLAITSFALGAASLVAGAVFFGLAAHDASKAKDACPEPGPCSQQGSAWVERGTDRARASEGLVGAGLALGGLGAFFAWGTSF